MVFKKGNIPWSKGKKNWNKYKHHSEEIKQLLSEMRMGKNNPMYGKKQSKEHREKISKGNKGKKKTEEWKNMMSKKLKGRYFSKETREKISKKCRAENNHFWRGGISFEPYNKYFNNKFKRAIRKRDNQICMLCGIHREKLNTSLSVHHINYNKLLSLKENCISLCKSCHTRTNSNREHWTKFFQSLLSERYGYNYSKELEPILTI